MQLKLIVKSQKISAQEIQTYWDNNFDFCIVLLL